MKFKLESDYKPTGDQPNAIAELLDGLKKGKKEQTLLGVTGSGKTFTVANVIEKIQKPTLVIAHNKTLAAQLYAEFKEFFPKNAVHFFVSYYDYYQPEAYIARSDTYIEKEATINEEIDRLRLASTTSLMTRKDVIVVASVSCIYGLGSPEEYGKMALRVKKGQKISREDVLIALTNMQYDRNEIDFSRGKIRARGDVVEVYPSNDEQVYRFQFDGAVLEKIKVVDWLTGEISEEIEEAMVFPARHWVTERSKILLAVENIRLELIDSLAKMRKENKLLEAQRLEQRTNYDIEMLLETGICNGIENYSRHLSFRKPGSPPSTLLDYFPKDFLTVVDESHMTIPQIGGMYHGDRARKNSLVEYGFRLPSAKDNRPLKFEEFEERVGERIYVSATPADFELQRSTDGKIKDHEQFYKLEERGADVDGVVEQIIRPTGLVDPTIEIRPTEHQIDSVIDEIKKRVMNKQRVLITTLTKRMAEDLTTFLKEAGIKAEYLHSDVVTLERSGILRDLRLGVYDVIVGINLLREGLDLPEVSLVIILDADKEGFLRSDQALIQTMGRAARHLEGRVIMYADQETGSMKRAIAETTRRRNIQEAYNKSHNITPESIVRSVRENILAQREIEVKDAKFDLDKIPAEEVPSIIKELEKHMDLAAKNLEFEKAATYRDQIKALREIELTKQFKRRIKK